MSEHPIIDIACGAIDVSNGPARLTDGGMDRIRAGVAASIESGTVFECANALVQFARFVDLELQAHALAGEILSVASMMNAALDEALASRAAQRNEALRRRATGFNTLFGMSQRPAYQVRKKADEGVDAASFLSGRRRILPR